MARQPLPWDVHRQILLDDHNGPAALLALADEIEDRGMRGADRDPAETADWLRAEVLEQ
jgi:hypothetical protein